MAILNSTLNSIAIGSKQTYFLLSVSSDNLSSTENRLYVADIEKNNSLESLPTTNSKNVTNISNLYDPIHKVIIHNLYQVNNINDNNELSSRGYSYKNKENIVESDPNSYSDLYINDYTPSYMEFLNDTAFILTNKLSSMCYYEVLSFNENENTLSSSFIHEPIYTALYPSVNSILDNKNSLSSFPNNLCPTSFVNGIKYNHFLELPTSIYGLFNGKTLLANSIIAKNHLGYDYSQHSESKNNNVYFSEFRNYRRIGSCAGTLYAVYDNNCAVDAPIPDSLEYGNIPNYSRPTYSTAAEENIDSLSASSFDSSIQKNYVKGNYERVEVIKSFNKYSSPISHKSNLYSIDIVDSGLNSLSELNTTNKINSEIITKIKKSISNGVRELCGKYTPGNTQLFNVIFSGN